MRINRFIASAFALALCLTAQARSVLPIQHWLNDKQVPVYFVHTDGLPMVDIRVAFDAGSSRDGQQYGLAQLCNALLDQGGNTLSADQIAMNFADVGAQYSANTYRDLAVVSLRSLTKPDNLIPALATFQSVLSEPTFSQHAFDRERQAQLMGMAYKKQRPSALGQDALYAALYPNHPYQHPVIGTAPSLRGLSMSDVLRFYQAHYTTQSMVIVMVGAIERQQAQQIANQLSQSLKKGHLSKPLPAAKPAKPKQRHIVLPVGQTTVLLGQLGIDHHDADYFPLLVANYSLGSGVFVSRLYQQVREKRGLSYGISSHFVPMRAKGPFVIRFATRAEKASQALSVTKEVVQKFIRQGPTLAELAAAKQNLVGGFPLNLSSNSAIASALLKYAYFKLPSDYFDAFQARIKAVSHDQAKKALAKHLRLSDMSVVTVGKTKLVQREPHAQTA